MGPLSEGEQNRLIIEFVGLVRPIAAAFYSATSPPLDDMVSEGHLGLVMAARKFDPTRSEFMAFATNGIRQHILNFIRRWKKRELPAGEQIERDWLEWQIWPHVAPFESWTALAATPEELLMRFQEVSRRNIAFTSALLGFPPRDREILFARFRRGQTLDSIARQHKISYDKTVRILKKMLDSIGEIVGKIERHKAA